MRSDKTAFVSLCIVVLAVNGCRKKPDASAEPPSNATNAASAAAVQTNAQISPTVPETSTARASTNSQVNNVQATAPSIAPIPATNKIAPPKGPGQDIYEQALAVLRTNSTPGAAEEAIILFRAAAEKGNASAEHALGVAYLSGLGVKKDVEEGIKWLQSSAGQKNANALFKLASLYARGAELPRDDAKAAELARQAAELGHPEAEYNLATLYASGRGVEKDIKQAAQWFQKAAEAGHPTAESNLGVLYATGNGVEKNPAEALKWWQKAAEQGQPSAQFNLAHLLREGKQVPQDSIEAYKWYHLAAEQGDPDAGVARDALGVEMKPSDVAEALKRAREFKAKLFAQNQTIRFLD